MASHLPAAERARRLRVGRALQIWGYLVLGGIVVLTALVVWHLKRRGRLLIRRPNLAEPAPWMPDDLPPRDPAGADDERGPGTPD